MARTSTFLAALMLLIIVIAPAGAQALSAEGEAVIAQGEHLLLVNFTVTSVPDADLSEAGSLRYLVYLDGGSQQTSFDVMLMSWDSYRSYLEGEAFQVMANGSFLLAGDAPALGYVVFLEEGDYVLVVDNTDLGTTPASPAELLVRYEYDAENLAVHTESRWDLFIALMVLVSLIGVGFLLLLRIIMRTRLAHAKEDLERRCPECGGMMPDYGAYCPNCGRKN